MDSTGYTYFLVVNKQIVVEEKQFFNLLDQQQLDSLYTEYKKGQMLLAKAQSDENNGLFMKSSVLSAYATSQWLTKKCMSVCSYFWPWAEIKYM